MSSFLYFCNDCEMTGKGWCLEGEETAQTRGRGPDGEGYFFMRAGLRPPKFGYYPDTQEWRNTGEGYWIGIDLDNRPDQVGLRRNKIVLPSYEVELGEEKWFVPIIRRPDGSTGLPVRYSYRGGELHSHIDRHLEVWEFVNRYAEDFLGEESSITELELFLGAVKILGINYWIGPHEASFLELLGSIELQAVCMSAIDGRKLLEFLKKSSVRDAVAEALGGASKKK